MKLRELVLVTALSGALALSGQASDASRVESSASTDFPALKEMVKKTGEYGTFEMESGQNYTSWEMRWTDPVTDDRYILLLTNDYFAIVPRGQGKKTPVDFGADGSLDAVYTNQSYIGEDQKLSLIEILAYAAKDPGLNPVGLQKSGGNAKLQGDFDALVSRIYASLPK